MSENLNEDVVEEELSLSDAQQTISPTTMIVRRFFRSRLSVVGLILLLGLFAFSFLGPLFSPYGELEKDTSTDRYVAVGILVENTVDGVTYQMYEVIFTDLTQNLLDYPSWEHWLGTDNEGYDILTRLMYGGQISLTIGFVVVFISTFIGITMGGLAGYFGGWVDQVIMRIVDIFYCVPTLPILLIASAIIESYELPGKSTIYFLMLILTVLGWAGTARMVRGQILMLREQEYITAATAMGLSAKEKITRHLIPNVLPQLIVSMTLSLGGVILTESTMSFIGLGVPLPYAAWGTMIGKIEDFDILINHFHLWGPPGFCIVLAVLGFNFVGDGLRDAFDPKMKR